MSDRIPIRTCVGCRQRSEQPALIRFVARDGTWFADAEKRADGRGAYLCSRGCAERVARNKRYPGLAAAAVSAFDSGAVPARRHSEWTTHMHK